MLVLITGLPGTGKSTVADEVARILGAPVLSHDWVMSGLRPYREIQTALDAMDPPGHRRVGWSLLGALARAQLRAGRSVVLDGVARAPEIESCRQVADEEDTEMALIVTDCSDLEHHRRLVEGRERGIPDWYELSWAQVQRSRQNWDPPEAADLWLDAVDPWVGNAARLHDALH
jgi:hypothetical protein